MPRTTYRFRVAPLLINDSENSSDQKQEQGEWSDITNIATKDNQTFEIQQSNPCATLVQKQKMRYLSFDKTGTIMSQYGYSFGEHLW